MRAPTRIRRLVVVAAVAAVAAAPAVAEAAQVEVTAVDGTFAAGDGGWTSSSSCAPLCTVTNAIDPVAGASTPGSATIAYSALAGLLGGLAAGTSTWASPSFAWAATTPGSAAITFARKAAIGNLLAVGGTATMRVQIRDETTSTTTTVASDGLSAADGAFATRSLTLDPTLLRQGHSYRVLVTTSLSAAALLSNIRVAIDDVRLTAMVTAPDGSVTGGGSSSDPATGATGQAPASGAAAGIRLSAPATVRFAPGRRLPLRVRALRAGRAVAGLTVTLRAGRTVFRLVTGSDGYASIGLLRRARTALRVTFRAGAATAATWARPR
jgi:hypothetical protein